ncbi:hypothetical protein M409DRAFT_16592 [Zasmidium cellare ATCC 36951]|uniref:Uncharacterized protein n=1 Tax=Zasmidium cellare ATCC 36951 TaxID=1080233 RepID=A0A6A6D2L0_ZASCE|nr:uncharacterized protein M409DRAFT_16592 [Zasmidium cellare ATCC 36951]KAF2172630.1 hypothetical protein M409DRAFT_16592 [Zasmidium cellare ATCC 36951]
MTTPSLPTDVDLPRLFQPSETPKESNSRATHQTHRKDGSKAKQAKNLKHKQANKERRAAAQAQQDLLSPTGSRIDTSAQQPDNQDPYQASEHDDSSATSKGATTRSVPLLDFTSYTKSEPFVFKSTMPGTYPEPIPAKRLKTAPDNKHDEGAFDDNAKSEHLQHQAEDSFLMSLREKLINARDSVSATVSAALDNPAGLSRQFVKQCFALVAGLLKDPAPEAVASEEDVAEKVDAIRRPTNKRTVDGTVKSKPRHPTLHKTQIQPQQRQSPTSNSVYQPDPPRHGSSRLPETPSQKPPKTPVQRVEVISSGEPVASTEVRVQSPAPGEVEKGKEAAMDPTPMPASEPGEVSPPVQPPQAPSTLGSNPVDEASTKAASPPLDYFTGRPIDYEMLALPKITCIYPRVFKDETTYLMFMSCMRGSTISAHSKLAIYLFLFHGGRSKVYISEASLLEAIVMMNGWVLAFFEPAVHREVVSWVQTEGARYVNFMRIALETSLVQMEAHHLYHVLFSGQPYVLNLTDTTIDRARQIGNDTQLRDRFPGIVHLFKQHIPLSHLEMMMEYDYTVMPEPVDTKMGGVEEVKVAPNVNQASNVGPPSNTNVTNNVPSTNAPAQKNAAPAPTSAPKLPPFSGLIIPSQNNASSQLNTISTANGVSNPSTTSRQLALSQANAPSQLAAAFTASTARNPISLPTPNPSANAHPGSSQQSAPKPGPTFGVAVNQRNKLNPRAPR